MIIIYSGEINKMFFGKIKKTAISIVLAIACVMVTCGITSDPAYAADMGAVYGI